ncbi:MAG: methyltransferase domain-containing protein [Candidatus Omnitrophica bacterium]|nr:methyltransferase domain-containing protein [Candidatus Omnitrophota bacterium]
MLAKEFHKKVLSKFSTAGQRYSELSSIQAEVARDLSARIPLKPGDMVLDIGCGAGDLAADISRRAPGVQVIGLDGAEGMLASAKSQYPLVPWIKGDALHLPCRAWSFDMVVSSSSYQWVPDLKNAFCESCRVLRRDGRFYAAFFGRRTLCEFFESLEYAALAFQRKDVFLLKRLPSEADVRAALKQTNFRHRGVALETREVVFRDFLGLFRWLKGIGANSLGSFYFGKNLFEEAGRYYKEHYGTENGIKATFEVIWVDAVK